MWHYSKTVDVPLYRAGDLGMVLQIEDVDREKVGALLLRQASPLRKFVTLAPKRADAVHVFAARLRKEHGLASWSRYANLANHWFVDREPREDGTPR
ncbi:hypothetical protein GCM10010207_73200 [Streptomyces atratus]|uniref:hypothetical protein n=1 Tax=Streptomyces atratus TaxID=1893 RepID=UPI00166FD56D|nr:hypothetical protein [Streptomyces atratus]GGT63125.1 hypothetical protein GCM10010207_73200 [Streptomyces atratus]